MIRGNPIGTPHFYKSGNTLINMGTLDEYTHGYVYNSFNVVNATPLALMDTSQFYTVDSFSVTASRQCGLVQQIAIPQPARSNAVPVELSGSFGFFCEADTIMYPIFGKAQSAVGSVLAQVNVAGPVYLEGAQRESAAVAGNRWQAISWRSQVVISNDDPANIPGTYVHGVCIYTKTAITSGGYFKGNFSFRCMDDDRKYYNPRRNF